MEHGFDDAQRYPAKLFYEYRPDPTEATYGNYMQGFNKTMERSLTALYKVPVHIPMDTLTAEFFIRPEEYEEYPIPYENYCLLNAYAMSSADVKGYPFYQDVVDMCPDIQFICFGGDYRDIKAFPIRGAVDLRGKTTTRQLVLLASKAKYILSGPSGIIHVGSAFPDVKKIVLIGAREPLGFWDYPNTVAISSTCGAFGGAHGCMHHHFRSGQCDKYCIQEGLRYAQCMSSIAPETVAKELHE